VSGVPVTFTAPDSSATLSATTAVTNAAGVASGTATAGSGYGTYAVIATTTASNGYLSATFSLTNNPPPSLTITASHAGYFTDGQNGTYTVVVSNALSAGPTNGIVTVTGSPAPLGLTLVSMTGNGWSNAGGPGILTRSAPLPAGGSYAAITVTMSVAANAQSPVTYSISVSGGGSAYDLATDSTVISPLASPPVLVSPANGGINVPVGTSLAWQASTTGATSYNVYFGTGAPPPFVANTSAPIFSRLSIDPGTTYYWSVSAVNGACAAPSATSTFTTYAGSPCDVNQDGIVNVVDIQRMINEVMNLWPPIDDVTHDGAVNAADVQKVIGGALGNGCTSP
jgi:hypothetical protein